MCVCGGGVGGGIGGCGLHSNGSSGETTGKLVKWLRGGWPAYHRLGPQCDASPPPALLPLYHHPLVSFRVQREQESALALRPTHSMLNSDITSPPGNNTQRVATGRHMTAAEATTPAGINRRPSCISAGLLCLKHRPLQVTLGDIGRHLARTVAPLTRGRRWWPGMEH